MPKLAEALMLRADTQKRIAQLKQRIIENAQVQEGDSPAENPAQLLVEFEQANAELVKLVQQINKTNSTTMLEDGLSIADALARRDSLQLQHTAFREIAQAALVKTNRFTRSELKFVSTINVREMQDRADRLSKEHRELDTKIQSANWNTDLL